MLNSSGSPSDRRTKCRCFFLHFPSRVPHLSRLTSLDLIPSNDVKTP